MAASTETSQVAPDDAGSTGTGTGTGTTGTAGPARRGLFTRLYSGTGAFDVVGNRKRWYIVVAVIVAICALSMIVRGFAFGIDFSGGTRVQLPAQQATEQQVETAFGEVLGFAPVSVQTVGAGDSASILIRSETLDNSQIELLKQGLFQRFQPVDSAGVPSANTISDSAVSETWGGDVSKKALQALIVFIVLVTIYITVRFEFDMALAALATLVFDLAVTAGVYSIAGFEVTPAAVIGFLTVLGFSLYDTVVVFDKVDENTRGVTANLRRTYAEQANLGINQTFMRSLNTSIISALPIIAMMVVAVWLLGVGTLKDLALVQLVGVVVGVFSSVFFATPLLVDLKLRRPAIRKHTEKVLARRAVAAGGAGPVGAGFAGTAVSADRIGTSSRAKAAPRTKSAGGASPRAKAAGRPTPSGKGAGSARPSGKRSQQNR